MFYFEPQNLSNFVRTMNLGSRCVSNDFIYRTCFHTVSSLDFRFLQNLFLRDHAPIPRPTTSTHTAVTGTNVIAISWEGGASAGAIFELRGGPSTSFSSMGCCGTLVVPGPGSTSACFAFSGCNFVVFGILGGTATGDGGIPNLRNNPCPGTTPGNNGGRLLPAEPIGLLPRKNCYRVEPRRSPKRFPVDSKKILSTN